HLVDKRKVFRNYLHRLFLGRYPRKQRRKSFYHRRLYLVFDVLVCVAVAVCPYMYPQIIRVHVLFPAVLSGKDVYNDKKRGECRYQNKNLFHTLSSAKIIDGENEF